MPSPGPRLTRLVPALSLVAGEAGAVFALVRLRRALLPVAVSREWLIRASDDELLGAAAWAAAALLVAWLVTSTVLYAAFRAVPGLRAQGAPDWLALPVVRRLVDRALAVSVGVGTLVATPLDAATAAPTAVSRAAVATATTEGAAEPSWSGETQPGPVRVHVASDGSFRVEAPGGVPGAASSPASEPSTAEQPVVRAPADDTTTTTVAPTTAAMPVPATRPPEPLVAPPVAAPRRHVVVPGDSLWSIARAEVSAVSGTPADDVVSVYWRDLVEANRASLRSGNPSLIYPGEIVTLPDR